MTQRNRFSALSVSVLKAMSLFGGVQVMNIVCSLVRNKIIALLIGPAGLGLVSIFNTTAELLSSVFSMGIRNSATRELAAAQSTAHTQSMLHIVRRWSWILAIIGFIATVALSPMLSTLSFGNTAKWWAFAILAPAILVNVLTLGELAVLQGTSRLRQLATATISGNLLGLLSVFPIIYFMRQHGVVLMIVAYYLLTGLAVWWVGKRKGTPAGSYHVSPSEALSRGKRMLMLGFMLTLSASLTYLFNYVFIIYLKSTGGESAVGLFQAGNMVVRRFADLVFAAMAVEYFPRLTSVSHSSHRLSTFVTQQTQISLSILIPLITIFIPLRHIVIRLLYSSEFMAIDTYIAVAATGAVWRAVSWCMAFVILAKGDGKLYLFTELISGIIGLALSIAGYNYFGLAGIGWAYVAWYIIYTGIIFTACRICYHIRFNHRIYALVALSVVITVTALWSALSHHYIVGIITTLVAIAAGIFSFIHFLHRK